MTIETVEIHVRNDRCWRTKNFLRFSVQSAFVRSKVLELRMDASDNLDRKYDDIPENVGIVFARLLGPIW